MDVAEAQAQVDELNQQHYQLLGQRDEITAQMEANSVELAAALDALAEAEQAAAAEARPDTSGALAPADPPPTTLGRAYDTSRTGR